MKLQMLKQALIAYVSNSLKAIWSAVAHPLTIVGKKNCDVADYRIYGNSEQGVGDLSRNVLDKDTVSFLRTSGSTKRTETGIALKPTTSSSTTTTYTHLDLGLMSDYEGQTVKASMELSRISEEGYGNTWFVIYDSANNKRTVIGTHRTDGDKIFLEANIKEGYTDERLTVRLYVTEAVSDTYYNFNNLMVYTGEDDADYEPYNKYKVPIKITCGAEEETVNIFLDEPLGTGQVIQMSKDNLPKLPQYKGTTVYEAQTEIPPSGIQVQYF